jgi:hypothetical protein
MGGWNKYTFDANVAVESSCDQSTDHCEDVTGSLNTVFTNAKVARIDNVLACR